MLFTVADKMTNTLDRCRLLLLAMRNFQNIVHDHGVSFEDIYSRIVVMDFIHVKISECVSVVLFY